MARYRTMGTDGIYGSDVEADSDEQAEALATKMGYEVLDITEDSQGLLLVIGDE